MDNKVYITVGFVRIGLDPNDKDVVEQSEDEKVSLILYNLLQSEHVPAVLPSKAGDGLPAEAFAFDEDFY